MSKIISKPRRARRRNAITIHCVCAFEVRAAPPAWMPRAAPAASSLARHCACLSVGFSASAAPHRRPSRRPPSFAPNSTPAEAFDFRRASRTGRFFPRHARWVSRHIGPPRAEPPTERRLRRRARRLKANGRLGCRGEPPNHPAAQGQHRGAPQKRQKANGVQQEQSVPLLSRVWWSILTQQICIFWVVNWTKT